VIRLYIYMILRTSLTMFSMWPYTLKFDEERSKHVNLAQKNGFGLTYLHSLLKLGKGEEKLWPKKNVINMIWMLFLVFYWPIITIGPNGLLLVHICNLSFNYGWGCKKGNN
jgi:hypothetical protein